MCAGWCYVQVCIASMLSSRFIYCAIETRRRNWDDHAMQNSDIFP